MINIQINSQNQYPNSAKAVYRHTEACDHLILTHSSQDPDESPDAFPNALDVRPDARTDVLVTEFPLNPRVDYLMDCGINCRMNRAVPSLQQPSSRVASRNTAELTSNQRLRIYYEWVSPVFIKTC